MEPWCADAILCNISVDIICAFFHRLVNLPIEVKYCKHYHVEKPCKQNDKRKVSFLPVE